MIQSLFLALLHILSVFSCHFRLSDKIIPRIFILFTTLKKPCPGSPNSGGNCSFLLRLKVIIFVLPLLMTGMAKKRVFFKKPAGLGFFGFYWAFLGFIGFIWVLLGFIDFSPSNYRVLLGFIGFYWVFSRS